ncbi:MAG: hypothetical protein AAB459_01905 [Patescibacteria group bacterium]
MNEDEQNQSDDDQIKSDLANQEVETHENDNPKESIVAKDKKNPLKRFIEWYKSHKKLAIPTTVAQILVIILLLPVSRMTVLGLFIKKSITIQISDTVTNKPVSGADVSLGSQKGQTGNDGKVVLISPLGKKTLAITKKYYKDYSQKITVDINKPKDTVEVKIDATGRQVNITVNNRITSLPLHDALISALDTTAKTDEKGKTTIVLPADKTEVDAKITKDGFNEQAVKIIVTDKDDPKNIFSQTPSGKIYFLSKLSGKIDVVKTNLDGSERKTVLAGTGKEAETETVMLASRDWKYLALKSRREGDKAKIYLIETDSDKLTTIDEGDAEFDLTGWTGNNFVFTVRRTNYQPWQPKAVALKSFDAKAKKLNVLDETGASGDQNNYVQENIGWVSGIGTSQIAYFKSWSVFHQFVSINFPELSGKTSQLITINLDSGTTKKPVKAYNLATDITDYRNFYAPTSSYSVVLYEPNEIYFATSDLDGTQTFSVLKNDKVTENSMESKAFFDLGKQYPTFLLSPDAKATFWSDSRDGKNALFLGDSAGKNEKQIVSLSEYLPYGWYSNEYLLVSKKGSELYIIGKTAPGEPVKVSDYYRPAVIYNGYGGGYGGL